jgi:pimeloyl-ACP methyl ester carboxylesterase
MLGSWKWRHSGMGFGGAFMDPQRIDGDFGELFLLPLLESRARLNRALRFLRNMSFRRMDEFRELHRELRMPVAFLWGAADPTFPELEARSMASQFLCCERFVSVPNAKLYVHEEHPDAVASEVCDFLRIIPRSEVLTPR